MFCKLTSLPTCTILMYVPVLINVRNSRAFRAAARRVRTRGCGGAVTSETRRPGLSFSLSLGRGRLAVLPGLGFPDLGEFRLGAGGRKFLGDI